MSKRWAIVKKIKNQKSKIKIDDVIEILLENRDLITKEDIDGFLKPRLENVNPKTVEINLQQLKKTIERIQRAIKEKEQIVIFGDYDVDGITGSAILWETLFSLGAKVTPYIPDRKTEGYGLSVAGIKNQELRIKDTKLIITVDNGIVANEAVEFANKNNIDVIITDHHTVSEKLPDAYAIVHTTKLCGAGVAYLLSKELRSVIANKVKQSQDKKIAASSRQVGIPRNDDSFDDNHLELAALGIVADLVPLIGANRAIVAAGLKALQKTKRPGLLALFQQARIAQETIGVYEIGYIIGPRLNASGRIESAMNSLRLLCTTNKERATELAAKLELVNRERQQLLKEATDHAIAGIRETGVGARKILIIGHENYEEGVIGLVAGRLVEAFYRPSIVLSRGETVSKASVRSISGFNIIEFLRMHTEHFVNVGGHPMAAGFTVETAKIEFLQKTLEKKATELIDEELLIRILKIDCEVPFDLLSKELYDKLQQLAPFGMANPEPVFATRDVTIEGIRVIGKEKNHLRLIMKQNDKIFEAIAFGMGELGTRLKPGDKIDVAYNLDENTWNGETKLQLKVKDILPIEI